MGHRVAHDNQRDLYRTNDEFTLERAVDVGNKMTADNPFTGLMATYFVERTEVQRQREADEREFKRRREEAAERHAMG